MISALVFPDGRRVELDEDIVVGRAPVAPMSSPSARSISLSVPTVSKTHALIGQDASGVWLIDLDSSNGSEVLDDAGMSERAIPGQRLAVPGGSHIRVGTDTIITIDSGVASRDDDDLDRTMVVRPASPSPSAPSPAPSPPVEVAGPTDSVDWSSVTDPDDMVPTIPDPAAAPTPYAVQPPPPAQPPPAQPPPSAATQSYTPTPAGFGSAPSPQAPPSYDPGAGYRAVEPAGSDGGRSIVHVVGALVVLVWSAVGFAGLRGWIPNALLDAIDGRIFDFFVVPERQTLEFAEFFTFAKLPDPLGFLAWGANIGPVVAIVVAIVVLISPKKAVRWGLAVLIVIPMLLLFGLLVTFFSDSFDFVKDEIDRFIPWFVLPAIGSILLLWPKRRTGSAPPPPQNVFYASGQPPEPPPSGPGASPFS